MTHFNQECELFIFLFCFFNFSTAFFCCCFCCILLSRLLTPFNNLKDKFLAYLCLNRSCRMWTELSFVAWRRAGRFNFYWLQRKSYSFKWMHQTLRHTYWNLHCERPIRIVFTRPGHLASQSGYWFRIDPLMPAYTPSLFCLCPGLFREKLLFAQFHHAYRAPYLAVFLTQTTSDITSPPYQPAPWSLLQIFVTSEGWCNSNITATVAALILTGVWPFGHSKLILLQIMDIFVVPLYFF